MTSKGVSGVLKTKNTGKLSAFQVGLVTKQQQTNIELIKTPVSSPTCLEYFMM